MQKYSFPVSWVVTLVSFAFPAALCDAADIFHFTSSPSSWVGHGQTKTYDASQGAIISVYRYFNQGAYTNDIDFSITQGGDWWYLDLVGPNLTLATTGSYPDAQRWPFQAAGHPGLDFSGEGRGNNTLTGAFTVLDAQFDPAGNVSSFAADFTQYDEGNLTWWNHGNIRYRSSIPIPEPASSLAAIAILLCALRSRRQVLGASR
jgi:hypothetical protein